MAMHTVVSVFVIRKTRCILHAVALQVEHLLAALQEDASEEVDLFSPAQTPARARGASSSLVTHRSLPRSAPRSASMIASGVRRGISSGLVGRALDQRSLFDMLPRKSNAHTRPSPGSSGTLQSNCLHHLHPLACNLSPILPSDLSVKP